MKKNCKKFDYFVHNKELYKLVNGSYEHGITDINTLRNVEIEIFGRKEQRSIGKMRLGDIFDKF